MNTGKRVIFIGNPGDLRNPVPKGTHGEYKSKKEGTEWHWVQFDGTDEAQTVLLTELDSVPEDQVAESTARAHILPIKKWMDKLTDEERVMLFGQYCIHCGTKSLPCYCNCDE